MNLSTVNAFKHISSSDAVELTQSDLDRLHSCLTRILIDIFDCCTRHGVVAFLAGGTALGAVRHGGFIPWDDDADVAVTREHYATFMKFFELEYGDKYWIHSPEKTHNYGLALVRIRKRGTSVVTREDLTTHNDESGAFVDVFVLENVFDNATLRHAQGVASLVVGLLYSCRRCFFDRKVLCKWMRENAVVASVFRVKMLIGFLTSALPLDFWVRLWVKVNSACRNNMSKRVAFPVGKKHFFGEMCPREELCQTRTVSFDDHPMPIPGNVENYLTRLYGPDYMTPPPPCKRERHLFFGCLKV